MKKNFLSSAIAAVLMTQGVVAADFQIEEVVVSAQKREQGLQDVPIAITAFQGDFIKSANFIHQLCTSLTQVCQWV